MIAAAAVDIRGGRCVQLVGGEPDAERVSLPDPVATARKWVDLGFGTLHVVDLDAALGTGDNLDLVLDVTGSTDAVTQVGGGIRDDARARALLQPCPPDTGVAPSHPRKTAGVGRSPGRGATRIVVGTRAVDDPDWLASLAACYPGRVMPALDVRGDTVLRKGWTESTALPLVTLLERLADLPLAGVLTTDVSREGRMGGMDRVALAGTLRTSAHPLWIAGGVTSWDDLEWLEGAGAAGAVLGMALYAGALDAGRVARRWGDRTNDPGGTT